MRRDWRGRDYSWMGYRWMDYRWREGERKIGKGGFEEFILCLT
jgi:hypothetical protein